MEWRPFPPPTNITYSNEKWTFPWQPVLKNVVFFGAKCGGVAQGVRVRFLAGKFVPLLGARLAPIDKGREPARHRIVPLQRV